jgi:flagellar protein FlgJ
VGVVATGLASSSSLSAMSGGSSATGSFDPRSLDSIRTAAKSGTDATATRKVAQQFESMFLSMMLKNMRATLPGSDPLASDASKMATDMYDQQLAQTMSKGKGIGLADALVAQIERAQGKSAADVSSAHPDLTKSTLDSFSDAMPASMTRIKSLSRSFPLTSDATSPTSTATPADATPAAATGASSVHHDFIDRFKDAAIAAAEATGLPAKVILGQAALESGWGKHEVRDTKGTGSFNLFGIKAPANWTGPTVDAVTTEVVNGVAQKVVQKFKAYASYAESFIDYAKMVANNPRYEKAVQAAGDVVKFATEMGKSGYATDPNYGTKLARVLTGPLSKLL